MAESVRLVVWDLDDTFWGGTLSEVGIVWRECNAAIVRTLSRRGIINSICSKNDPAPVLAVLEQHGLRDHFVFPSISWDAKGPRLAALVQAVQLRAETILFIDDNPMNRAEALHFVPGLQVADETIVPRLLADPRLTGKADPDMTRLAQYRLLERRQQDQAEAEAAAGGDTTAFLRDSGITVSIEHDLEPHLDRAIELINRTNQLNFTKRRLPEDIGAARAELRKTLSDHSVQAGILRVHDRYGDYGYCGLYILLRNQLHPHGKLLHFAFS
jgi:FkbH-like protein